MYIAFKNCKIKLKNGNQSKKKQDTSTTVLLEFEVQEAMYP